MPFELLQARYFYRKPATSHLHDRRAATGDGAA
jgi:hypothetical protein